MPHLWPVRRSRSLPITSPHLLIFTLDDRRYALRLDAVERVIRAAATTPLPGAPEIVLGILDLQGRVIPVINLRKRFRVQERGVRSSDQFVVAVSGALTVALAVDGTDGVLEPGREMIDTEKIVAGMGFLEGVTRTEDGLVLIHDLERLLFAEEEELLARALAGVTP